jgi:hypothetical protein
MNSFSKRFLVALILTTLLLVALIAYSTLLDIPIVYTMGGYDDLPVVVYAAVGWSIVFIPVGMTAGIIVQRMATTLPRMALLLSIVILIAIIVNVLWMFQNEIHALGAYLALLTIHMFVLLAQR